jgi:hypothetical protein
MEFVKKYKKLIIGAAIALILIIVGSSVRNDGIKKETALVAQYQDNQNELSAYILKFNESLGIADRQSNKLNEILLDAVKGRYDNDTSLEPGTGGTMFSAITEAYPDLTATSETYAKVQDLIVSGRDAYKNKQSLLLDRIRDYNEWRATGLTKSWLVNTLGFPTDNLKVTVGTNTYRGLDALDQISRLVLTQDAITSYETGTQDPLLTPEE